MQTDICGKTDITKPELYLILKKLIKDDNIESRLRKVPNNRHYFMITFEGRLFKDYGGYAKNYNENKLSIDRQESDRKVSKRNEMILAVGSVAAGIGTLGLLLWELRHLIVSLLSCH